MFNDKLKINDDISVGLSCGSCGEPATKNHICEEKEECQKQEVEKKE
jgi:hypothetical protein